MREHDIKKSTAAFIDQATPVRSKLLNPIIIILAAFVFTGIAYGAYSFMAAPRGKITSPTTGTNTSRIIAIEGYTKRIPPDRRYVWVMVEIEARGLCWPKRPIYKPNSTFKTTILEKGPNNKFTVSLYAVDKASNDEILHWIAVSRKSGTEPGLNIMPEEFRLDTVMLNL